MRNMKKVPTIELETSSKLLITDISKLVDKAQDHIARQYNSTQMILNWMIGKRIDEEFLKLQRAEYGESIIASISDSLSLKYGTGFTKSHLFRMVKFARVFPQKEIVATVSPQLSWSHVVLIIVIDDPLQRDFYIELTRIHHWSVRRLKKEIDSMLFQRTVISKKPEETIKQSIDSLKEKDEMSPLLTFKDPYFINFIRGNDKYSEADFENFILNNITDFLQELGNDFCFVARQKRMSTTKTDRYLDLLFFNRRLKRLIAIDLKVGKFEPAYKGQMEWYLGWLDKHERLPEEHKPIGIILCADKDQEDIEYMGMDKSDIHVAEYIFPKEALEQKLKQAVIVARENHLKMDLFKDN